MKKKKVKRGRPQLNKKPQRQRAVSLDDSYVKRLLSIGDGNISAGIRKAVDVYEIT